MSEYYIDVGSNKIEEEGAISISNALKNKMALRVLDISNNNIQEKGAIVVAHMLIDKYNIEALLIDDNDIGMDGAQPLIESMIGKKNLKAVCIIVNRHARRQQSGWWRCKQHQKEAGNGIINKTNNDFLYMGSLFLYKRFCYTYAALISLFWWW